MIVIEKIQLVRLCGTDVILTTAILKRGKNRNGNRSVLLLGNIIRQICAKFHLIWFTHFPVKSNQIHVHERYR